MHEISPEEVAAHGELNQGRTRKLKPEWERRYCSLGELSEFADLVGELPGNELELDMFGVEGTASRRAEASANCLNALNRAAELQPFHPHRGGRAVPYGQYGPHVGAQSVDRRLEVLQSRWSHGGAPQALVDVVEQFAEGNQLLGERLVRHGELSFEESDHRRDHG